MDICKHFQRRKLLKTNLGTYDLTLCRWKGLASNISKRKQICNLNAQGYIHAAAKIKDTIFTIVGPDQQNQSQTMHSFNFRSCQWKQWEDSHLPEDRDSFGLTTHLNQLYLFGGSNQVQQFGDTYIYNTFNSNWTALQGTGPSPRNPMVFTDVDGKYILMYGGIDIEAEVILEDAYLLIEGVWRQLDVLGGAPNRLTGARTAVCADKVFLFGGERQPQSSQPIPNTILYQLIINQAALSLQFVEISPLKSSLPSPRTSHSMVGLNSSNFVVVGGVSLMGSQQDILRDMWVFNCEEQSWERVDPANGILRGFCDSTICLQGSKLYVIGGLVERLDTWNQQVSVIEFGEDQTIRNQICGSCQMRLASREKEEKGFPKTIVMTNGFFYNISLELRHPFQAISALYQCAAFMEATTFRLLISKGMSESQYIQMQWNGRSLSKPDFEQLICHSTCKDDQLSRFINILKIASFRLGKTLLFISTDENYRQVFLLSADSKICPQFDQSYTYFAFIENLQKGLVESHQGRSHQKIILNFLRSRFSQPEEILERNKGTYLLIFEKNILITSEKTYYYELISSSTEDITVFRNNKKLQFLQEIGYSLSHEPELSLQAFVGLSSLTPLQPFFYLNRHPQTLPHINYLEVLKNMESSAAISRIHMPAGQQGVRYESWVYQVETSPLVQDNYGILIYHQGKLLNRFETNFGDLFKQHFYKVKYKQAETVFTHLGVINVEQGLTLNYLSTWFKKDKNYYQLVHNIRAAIRGEGIQGGGASSKLSAGNAKQ